MSKERELLKTILAYMANEYLVMTEFEMITQIEDTVKEITELLAQPERKPLTNTEKMELHGKLRQHGSLTKDGYWDGCWDAIEVFQKFLQERAIGVDDE